MGTILSRGDNSQGTRGNSGLPAFICRVKSGLVSLCKMQYLAGYCILQADPAVSSLNDLLPQARADFLTDMARVGDALLHVTGAYRINYAIMGNSDPTLHAHIVPRYLDEAEALRKGHPWIYPAETMSSILFDASRDQDLIRKIAAALYTV